MTILKIAAKLRELTEQYGEEFEGGKNLDLCEEVELYPTIFFDMRRLLIERVRTIDADVILTDKDGGFIITISEDEEYPGESLLIYENLQVNGSGCSEVGECEDLDTEDLERVLKIAIETIKQRA